MNIEKWWQWVLAIGIGLLVFLGVLWALFKLNDVVYDGDRTCMIVKCVKVVQ